MFLISLYLDGKSSSLQNFLILATFESSLSQSSNTSKFVFIDGESSLSQSSSKENKDKKKESENKDKLDAGCKPLLNKNYVLGILSELVKSYSGLAQLIAEFEVQKPVKEAKSQVCMQIRQVVSLSLVYDLFYCLT